MQKRLVRKLDLEMLLSRMMPHPSPDPSLEQYTISADVAAAMLYMATYVHDCIIGKTVLDLGCGTGRLALGAAVLGAEQVIGVDIDKMATRTAHENAKQTGINGRVQWITADIDAVDGNFETVLQNPPFGVQQRGADQEFLEKALEVGKIVYSLHKSPKKDKLFIKKLKSSKDGVLQDSPNPFLEKIIRRNGGRIRAVYAMVMTIPHMFSFHMKRKHEFVVDLYFIEKVEEDKP